MNEPNPEDFGLKYIINSNEYEFINKSKPKPSDYGLTDEYCKNIKDNHTNIIFDIIAYILVILVLFKIFNIDLSG